MHHVTNINNLVKDPLHSAIGVTQGCHGEISPDNGSIRPQKSLADPIGIQLAAKQLASHGLIRIEVIWMGKILPTTHQQGRFVALKKVT